LELKITVKQAVPLALMYEADGHKIEGKTRLQKLTFLAQGHIEESDIGLYEFIEYDHGPFSKKLLEDVEMYEQKGLVKIEKVPTFSRNHRVDYSLTSKGIEIFEDLVNKNEKAKKTTEIAAEIIEEYNDLSIRALMDHVYESNPRFKQESVHY
jgi:hypothetical protein